MVLGLGVDTVEISRIAAAYERHQGRFLERLLAEGEQDYWRQGGSRIESLAGMWAAKEAVAKALGTGFSGFGLRDVVIGHDHRGGPTVTLLGGASQFAGSLGIERILVTISHSTEQAVAFAVAEGNEQVDS